MPNKVFPIMCGERVADHKSWIPWVVIAPHGAQAERNHSQSLERLAERGGLAPCEAVAVLEDRAWQAMPQHEARYRLGELLDDFVAAALAPPVTFSATTINVPQQPGEGTTTSCGTIAGGVFDPHCNSVAFENASYALETVKALPDPIECRIRTLENLMALGLFNLRAQITEELQRAAALAPHAEEPPR